MIRDRKRQLIAYRVRRKTSALLSDNIVHPGWMESYYTHKQTLKEIQQNNMAISNMIGQYHSRQTVSAYSLIQSTIAKNLQLIENIESWISKIQNISNLTTINRIIISAISQHTTQQLSQQLKIQIHHKQQIQSMQRPSNPVAQSPIQQVKTSIKNLNDILKRMNGLLSEQGQSLNRIDNNIEISNELLGKGNFQLGQRLEKEEGQGQFVWDNRINKVISSLYFLNIGLIIVFFIKNII